MKYAILGAGAMGSIIGAVLAKAGQDVILVDPYQEHMNKIQQDGLRLTLGTTTEMVPLTTYTDPNEAEPVDMVILLVKRLYSTAALQGAERLFSKKTYVCSLQNGLGNADDLEPLFSRDRILHGLLKVAGRLIGPGEVVGEVGAGDIAIYLGSLTADSEAVTAGQALADHLTQGGLHTKFTLDVERYVWEKAVMNICFNAPCGLLRLNVREMITHSEGNGIVRELAKETVAVAAEKGILIDYDQVLREIEATATMRAGDHYPSMAQDMKNKRKTEIDSLNGAIVRYGKQLGIPTPANDYVTRFVKVIEDRYEVQF